MNVVKKYSKEEANQIEHMLSMLVMELETNPRNVLGETYMELDMGNDRSGQFFTPYNLSVMMAKMTMTDAASIIDRKGYMTVQEPAVGAGGMVIAMAGELADQEINYQQHMHVTAFDIDPICVHMAYLQLSLLHIPAVVVHGNTLTLEDWGRWHTPAHILDGWDWKLKAADRINKLNAFMTQTQETTVKPEKPVHSPVINLFDGAKDVTVPPPKKDEKPNPKPQGGGQQLKLF